MIKVLFRKIHLYLGLAAGLVIMMSCFTGAVLVFEDELQHFFYKERYFVKPENSRVPADKLIADLKTQVKNIKVTGVKYYSDPERSAEIAYTIKGKKETQKKSKEKKQPGKGNENNRRAFINPYTGEILALYNHQETFFYTMFALHRWLLAGTTGKLITGISTLIFLIILTTGIILWWPKNKAILKQRLSIKKDAGWKRLNHDWHIVLGFYSALFLFVFAFTALAWSFEWFNDGIYKLTNSTPRTKQPESKIALNTLNAGIENIMTKASQREPDAVYYNINFPKDSAGVFSVTVLPLDASNESRTNNLFFDQYSGELIKQVEFSDRNLGQKIRATFKPLHIGSIWGLPSKIVAFIVCMLGTTFPVTGVIMWVNRSKKSKKKKIIQPEKRKSAVAMASN